MTGDIYKRVLNKKG